MNDWLTPLHALTKQARRGTVGKKRRARYARRAKCDQAPSSGSSSLLDQLAKALAVPLVSRACRVRYGVVGASLTCMLLKEQPRTVD